MARSSNPSSGVDFATDRLIIDLSGSQLFQTETDGSSFPNGGLRDTHQAAAYIGWDTGSPPFVYRQTLYIPSAFVTWNGEALDQKTPCCAPTWRSTSKA